MRAPVLQRRPYVGESWPVSWCDPTTGELLLDRRADSIRLDPLARGSGELLDYLALQMQARGEKSATVYLSTGDTAASCPPRDWYAAAAASGWQVMPRMGSPTRRAAICRRDGLRIDLRHTAAWFPGSPPLAQMRMVYGSLRATLMREFGRDGDHVTMRGTPAQTGLALLDISLPKDRKGQPYQFAPLSDDARELLSEISFQHRHELYRGPTSAGASDDLSGFAVWDARLAYARFLRDAPTGEPLHDRVPLHLPYRAGWYRVRIAIAPGWRHVGLAMKIDDRTWPRHGWFETWISEPELRLLRSTPGWSAEVIERLIWPNRTAEPLREWGDRLIGMYLRACELPDREISDMMKGAVRAMIIGVIGALGREHGVMSVVVPFGDPIHPSWSPELGPYGWECQIPRPLSTDRLRYRFPQIPAHIYAQQRASLARFGLAAFAPHEILGCHTDAWMVARHVEYRARPDAEIGGYRVVGSLKGPLRAPASWEDLRTLVGAARGSYRDGAMSEALYDGPGSDGSEGNESEA